MKQIQIHYEIKRAIKKKSFTDDCMAAMKKRREESAANVDADVDFKELHFKKLKKNKRKRNVDDVYVDGEYKQENEPKRFKDDDGGRSEKGEVRGSFYIEGGVCYKESDEDAAHKDGFCVHRDGKYYKRLD